MQVKIFLNGEAKQFDQAITIAHLLNEAGLAERRVAVEVNRDIVPRSLHAQTLLNDGDRVEVVHALGGG